MTPEPRLVYPHKQTNSRGSKALNKCATFGRQQVQKGGSPETLGLF